MHQYNKHNFNINSHYTHPFPTPMPSPGLGIPFQQQQQKHRPVQSSYIQNTGTTLVYPPTYAPYSEQSPQYFSPTHQDSYNGYRNNSNYANYVSHCPQQLFAYQGTPQGITIHHQPQQMQQVAQVQQVPQVERSTPQVQWHYENIKQPPMGGSDFKSTSNYNESTGAGYNGVKLPPLSNFYDFKKPIVVDPTPKVKKNTTVGLSQSVLPCNAVNKVTKAVVDDENMAKPKNPTSQSRCRVEKVQHFKKNTKFLSRINIDDEFLIKHIKMDPSIKINFELEVQPVELSKDQLTKYVLHEFIFEILKFNDKRDSNLLIDNFPENRIDVDLKFELEQPGMQNHNRVKIIKIWLNLLKPSESNITKDKILKELTTCIDKFMETPDLKNPTFDFKKGNNKEKFKNNHKYIKPFRPSWRLGAKDELSVIEMRIEILYPEIDKEKEKGKEEGEKEKENLYEPSEEK